MAFFGDNTQDVSGLPQDDTMMQLELKRRLDMAKALQQQEMPQGQMVSGHYVAPHWTQQLAALGNQIVGRKQEENAMKQYGDYQKSKSAKLGTLLDELNKGKQVESPVDYQDAGGMPGITQTTQQPFNQQEYMAKIGAVMPEMLPKMLEANFAQRFKEQTPIKGGPGDRFFDPVTHKEIFAVPAKEDKTTFSTLGKLTSELQQIQSANPNDPRIPQYQDAIKKETTANPGGESNIGKLTKEMNLLAPNDPLRATYRAAIAKETRIAPEAGSQPPSGYGFAKDANGRNKLDENGNPILTQLKGGPADKPLKEIPPTARASYSANQSSLKQIDDAIAAVEKAPDEYFGLQAGLGNTYMSRRYPDSVGVRQAVNGIASVKRHDLLGGAVTPSENASTAPLIPQPNDDRKTVLTKLHGLRDNYATQNESIAGNFGEEYSPLNKSERGASSSNGFSIRKLP